MRTYDNMITEYLAWYAENTSDDTFKPETYLSDDLPKRERDVRKAKIWDIILNLSYDTKNGMYWFCKFILGDMMYAGYPEPIRFNKLWSDWTSISKHGDHLLIKCPRQHSKSTYWTVVLPIYRGALFENYNILIESASEEQAVALLTHTKKVIDNNEFLSSKKAISGRWSTTDMTYNGGVIRARGVGSEVRGGTYDYIVCDDILRSDNKLSDEEIEKFIDEELEPMLLVRNGQLVIVGTPKSETDIFNTIEDRIEFLDASWNYHTYQAIIDWDKKIILSPYRFTWEQLMSRRRAMGRMKFDKEFQCLCYSSGSQLFPYGIRKRAMELGKEYVMYNAFKTKDKDVWHYYIGVDCARAGTAGGDYTVVTVIAYKPKTQEKRIVWLWRKKGLKIAEQVKQIAAISKRFNHPIILVERNNIGQDFIDIMTDDYGLNVEEFTTGSKGQAKEDLIRYLIVAFEREKIIMPIGDEESRKQMKLLNKELERFVVELTRTGNEVFKGSGHSHDDMVISLALANRCSQSFGYVPFATSFDQGPRSTTSLERFAASGDVREVLTLGF